ncbi:MAG: hypothetical protein QM718_11790 [Steroidobacteraceae bacterium]
MKAKLVLRGGALLLAAAIAFGANTPDKAAAIAQGGASGKGYSWADVARWPNINGNWAGRMGPGGPGEPGGPGGTMGNLSFTATYSAAMQTRSAMRKVGVGNCEPMGVIGDSGSSFYVSRDVIIIGGLSDWYNVWRRVYMDGRGHPDDVEPSYFGHSIGHWEGDTLVVDTVAIRHEAQIQQGMPADSDNTHVVERFKVQGDTLQLTKTVIRTCSPSPGPRRAR